MNATAKKLVVTVAVATITLLGVAAPAEAAKVEQKHHLVLLIAADRPRTRRAGRPARRSD